MHHHSSSRALNDAKQKSIIVIQKKKKHVALISIFLRAFGFFIIIISVEKVRWAPPSLFFVC